MARCDSKPIPINHQAAVNNFPCNSNILREEKENASKSSESVWLVAVYFKNYIEKQLKNHEKHTHTRHREIENEPEEEKNNASKTVIEWRNSRMAHHKFK